MRSENEYKYINECEIVVGSLIVIVKMVSSSQTPRPGAVILRQALAHPHLTAGARLLAQNKLQYIGMTDKRTMMTSTNCESQFRIDN
jgi:hypothetical protein